MAKLNLRNPTGYDGSPGTVYKQGIVRFATVAEAAAGIMDNVAISPATAQAATALDFASPPVLGFGSTTPRPVHATTLDSTGLTSLATGAGAVANIGNATGTIGFFGVTAAARPAATADIKDGLALMGLLTNGGATPLNLDGGTLTAGVVSSAGAVTAGTTMTAGTGITATTGDITASAGNLVATLGSVSAGTTVTAGTSITATLGNITATNGNLVLSAPGNKLVIAAAAPTTDSVGTTDAMVAGAVTITSSAITASSKIIYSRRTLGTAMGNVSITAQAGGSATLTSDEGTETSTFDYLIIN